MSFRCLGNGGGAYDCRMEGAWHNDEDFLYWRRGQFNRSSHYDLNRNDQHRPGIWEIFQTVPLVYVSHAEIQI